MTSLAPQNVVHVTGGQATPPLYFNCSIELASAVDSLIWNKLTTQNTEDRIATERFSGPLMVQDGFDSEYDVEGNSLIVKDADLDDAGTYRCRNNIAPRVEHTAEAIVFGMFIARKIYFAPNAFVTLTTTYMIVKLRKNNSRSKVSVKRRS